jgi:hypothetical protein
MELEMKTIKVKITADDTLYKGDMFNYMVTEADGDLGRPIGVGATKKEAVESFIESWLLKYDEEIEVSY